MDVDTRTVPEESRNARWGYKGGFFRDSRIVWAPLILVGVGIASGIKYPTTDMGNFYTTTALVIVALYIGLVVGAITLRDVSGAQALTTEHWIFLVVSCAGLVASIRAVSMTQVHPWLTGLSVAGLVAMLLIVAEMLIGCLAARDWAWLWSTVFVLVITGLVLF